MAHYPTSRPILNQVSPEDVEVIRHHSRRMGLETSVSQSGGLLLDPSTLNALSLHFERLLDAISYRVESLSEQTRVSTLQSHRHCTSVADAATAEIMRFREILRQIDELEVEFDRIRRIKEIVANFRRRVESIERRMGH